MHELSLAEGIRAVIMDLAGVQGFARVTVVRLEIGRFAGVEKQALAFAFDEVMRGGPAEGARLEMIDLPGQALCYDCMTIVELTDRLDDCPQCGGTTLMPSGGDAMRIKNMEVV